MTPAEFTMAIQAATNRWLESEMKGRRDSVWEKANWIDSFLPHLYGAIGECVVAKDLNIYWPAGLNSFKSQDVGKDIEVRFRTKHTYDLKVSKGDSPNKRYILVTGLPPHSEVRGWLWGREAQQEKYLANPGGYGEAYFVPASELNSMWSFEK